MKALRFGALLLAALLTFSLAACQKEEAPADSSSAPAPTEAPDPNWPARVGDVTMNKPPERVVSLSPAVTELIYELGAQESLCAVAEGSDYPEAAQNLPVCGSAELLDFGMLEELSPDLLLASYHLTQEDTVRLQQMGCEVMVLPRADSFAALEQNYVDAATLLLGKLYGPELGAGVFAPLRARYDALLEAAAAIPEEARLTGIYLRAKPLMMATGDTLEGELLTQIGVINAAGEYTGWEYPQEKAADLYPDIIFYDPAVGEDYLKETQVYNTTDAVKNNNCFPVDSLAFERQSGRMIKELERMFLEAYPDANLAPADTASQGETDEEASGEAGGEAPSGGGDEMLPMPDEY